MNKIIPALCFSALMMPSLVQAETTQMPEPIYDKVAEPVENGQEFNKNTAIEELTKSLVMKKNEQDRSFNSKEGTLQTAAADNTAHSADKTDAPVPTIKKPAASGAAMPPLLKIFIEQAPDWVYDPLLKLNQAGLINPDDIGLLSTHNLNRREAAILTARAYNFNKRNNALMEDTIEPLMQEFSVELSALGYNISRKASRTKAKEKIDMSLAVHGEIRYNIISNSSSTPKYNWNDSRLRARIYLDKAIDNNWAVHGMIQMYQSIFGSNKNNRYYTKSKEKRFDFERWYLTGKMNLFNLPINVEAGAASAFLAEGNVLDSSFKGIKLSSYGPIHSDQSTLYSLGYGKVNDTQKMFYTEIHHTAGINHDYMAGYYRWDNYGRMTDIYSLGTNYYIGNYTLGAIYLKASEKDGSGATDAYVLTAKYGRNRSWVGGTYEVVAHYYDMAGKTYINHTMSGLGGYMDGFKGYSAGWYYTVIPNVLLTVEYYDLKDKTNGDKVKTWWGEISYSF